MPKKTIDQIRTEVLKAAGIEREDKEDLQVFLGRIVKKIAALDDEGWDKLSGDAQDWYNTAADAKNKKSDIDTLGLDDEEEEKPAPRKARAKAEPEEEAEAVQPKEGDKVTFTYKGDDLEGVVTDIDAKRLTVEIDGEEDVYILAKVEGLKVVPKKAKAAAKEEEAPAKDPKPGDVVEVTMTDGEVHKGSFVEQDEKYITIDEGGEEEAYPLKKVKGVKVVGNTTAKAKAKAKDEDDEEDEKPARKTSTRKAAADDDEAEEKKPAAKAAPKKEGAEPATVAARRMICQHPDWESAKVLKALQKAGVEIKEATFSITYGDAQRTIKFLREAGMLKED